MSNNKYRSLFPALEQKIRGQRFVYLDSAATSLKPKNVIDRIHQFYSSETANVHRGAHFLSDRATQNYENVRVLVQNWIGAKSSNEVIFTSGTTDGINLLATSLAEVTLKSGDEILISEMEHHSNLVPWQRAAEKYNAKLKFIEVLSNGEINLDDLRNQLSAKTKVVAITHCSNVLGTVNPISEISKLAHEFGALVVVDAAQSVSFQEIDVEKLGCDFLVFSAHKIYGPYGVGVLWGKLQLLNILPPYRSGGSMIRHVKKAQTTYLDSPQRFEAGTPNISGVLGLGAAIEFLNDCELKNIQRHEKELLEMTISRMNDIPGIQWVGSSDSRVNLASFVIKDIHPSDLGQLLDQQGIAIRTGHHCAQPLLEKFGVTSTARVSFGIFNDHEDVEQLIKAVYKAVEMLK